MILLLVGIKTELGAVIPLASGSPDVPDP